jgi:hypothetical protein
MSHSQSWSCLSRHVCLEAFRFLREWCASVYSDITHTYVLVRVCAVLRGKRFDSCANGEPIMYMYVSLTVMVMSISVMSISVMSISVMSISVMSISCLSVSELRVSVLARAMYVWK